ncbi:uncharacterized protein G2W53_013834 [Senna tora]|uniref:Uncharacterized protein n=1 Tax=Senna tora TaxID=362788 RepID=A0A834WSC3_9FABA|nr:uncharacterized protein G2W53_013834 [Senna tora]
MKRDEERKKALYGDVGYGSCRSGRVWEGKPGPPQYTNSIASAIQHRFFSLQNCAI